MATGKSGPSGFEGRPSDPYVQQRITDPAAAVPRTVTLTGLLGDSDRAGRRRLYFTTALDYYAEFASADVVAVVDVPADQPPFRGLDATRVVLKRDARVEYTHARVAAEDDQFDLAPRRRRPPRGSGLRRRAFGDDTDDGCGATDDDCPPETWEAECNPSFDGDCNTDFGCGSDNDCPSGWTVCKPHTCACTEAETCATCHATCAGTCANTCRATCAGTCAGTCANTCAGTCAATCAGTCVHTCAGTCANTCAGTCGIKCEPTFAQTHCFTCRAGCNPV